MSIERIKELLKVERQIESAEARLVLLKTHREEILLSLNESNDFVVMGRKKEE